MSRQPRGGGARTTLGLDLGGSAIKWLVLEGEAVVAQGLVPTPLDGCDAVVAAMAGLASGVEGVDAVGVGVPGLFDAAGRTDLVPNVPGRWDGYPFADRLHAAMGVPVALANDGRAATLAELRLGSGRGARHLIAVTVGTGIGGGIAVNGRVHLGRDGRAGEIGHQFVDAAGPLCGCGAYGCVEVFASAPAIRAAGARAVWQGVDTVLRERAVGDPPAVTVEMVLDAAREGDAHACDIVVRAGRALGIGLANLCNALAPEVIVIGGGVAGGLDVLEPILAATLRERARLGPLPRIVPATLGPHTGAMGAALWARERPDLDDPPV